MVEDYEEDIKEKAIGGWLPFFILILIVITPLGSILSLILEYKIIALQIDLISGSYQAGNIVNGLLKIAVSVFSVYAGMSLLKRKRNAIPIVKTYLAIFLCYSIVSVFFSFIVNLSSGYSIAFMKGEAWKRILYALIFVAVWYIYLSRSRRIKEIYDYSR